MTDLAEAAAEDVPSARTVQKELWICDVCKVKKFEDFEEACRHEETCKMEKEPATKREINAANDSLLATNSVERKKKNEVDDNDNHNKISRRSSKKIPKMFDVQKKAKCDFRNGVLKDIKSNCKSESQSNKQRGTVTSSVIDLQRSSSSENSLQSTKVEKGIQSPNKRTNKRKPADSQGSVNVVHLVHPAENQKKPKKKPKTKGTKSNQSCNTATLATIFQKDKNKSKPAETNALMAEQVAAEFQAKRRLERERDRERQKKRQETFFKPKINSPSKFINSGPTSKPQMACPRFPVPSFVHPPDNTNYHDGGDPTRGDTTLASMEGLAMARILIQKSLKFPGRQLLEFTDEGELPWTYSNPTDTDEKKHEAECIDSQSVQKELVKILTISEKPESSLSNTPSSNQSLLWVDKDVLDFSDICGETNKSVAKHMEAFVREWMVERHKAHQRMAERQKALRKQRKTAKSKKKAQDEDLWMDYDSDCDSEDLFSLPSICLIEGPVGSCKSSLVHAVARKCECPVVELNTSEKRGSANLRKILEEATVSHSSLEMLKKREANLCSLTDLVDSDEESNSEQQSGSSLTVILIDEGKYN